MPVPPSSPGRAAIPIRAESAVAAAASVGVTRRAALQAMAASLALAGAACTRTPSERIHPYVTMPEAGRGGLPAYYASAFVRDGHATGVLVGTREGRPIKIEGNPDHPSSLGATDVFAQASILELWDPDRSQTVRQQQAPSTWAAFESAWRARATTLDASRGRGLAVLTPRTTSPTFARQLVALLERFPQARWHRHAPLAPVAARAGARLAFGRECDWLHRFDRADFIVALDADPFSHVPGHLRHARDWASRRAGSGAGENERATTAPRTLAIESTPGLFGARADERIALAPAQIDMLVEAIARSLFGAADSTVAAAAAGASPATALPATAPTSASPSLAPLAERIAARLRAAGAAGLVVAGPHLAPATHARVAAIHQRLGAIGATLDAIAPLDAIAEREPRDLAALVAAIEAGAVDTLLVVGGNPVHDAPGAIDFAAALRRVAFSAHLSSAFDETSRAAAWHLPASHEIESWGDALGHDGTATIVQPAILPLYDTRSPIEWLAILAGDDVRDGHAIVQATWRARLGAGTGRGASDDTGFANAWVQSLRAGVVATTAAPPLALPAARDVPPGLTDAAASGAHTDALVAVCAADASLDDGRFANNGWLQELPRPFTKLTWGNAIHLGPRTAARYGVASGDVVRLSAGGRAVEGPVWVLAEQAEGVATLPLGYGRRAAGRVGDGVGFAAFALRDASDAPLPVELARTGRSQRFAVTQHRLGQEGRDLARSIAAGAVAREAETAKPSLYPPIAYPEHAWAMAIDLDACIGCNACTIACQAENNIPVVGAEEVERGREMHWIRVDRHADAGAGSVFQPVPCMHCEDAPCEVVCPVGATVHDSDGLNVQVYNRCVGTRFCSNNCPYKVRRFNFFAHDDDGETLKAMRNPDVTVRRRGVMEKCTYCIQRIERAKIGAETSGRALADGDVLTACQTACPTRAIRFGDLADKDSAVARAKASPRHYAMLDELNTRPRTTYLARVVAAAAKDER